MNMSYKAASSVGAVLLVLSGASMAAMPADVSTWFDRWSVNNGTIDTSGFSCLGDTCSDALKDKGFLQRTISSGTETYFQTIITENDATAANATAMDKLVFSDESFVQTGNKNGIADKQRIYDKRANTDVNGVALVPASDTEFQAKTMVTAGWAGSTLKLSQFLLDHKDNFQTDFFFAQNGPENKITGRGLKITQYVPIQGTDRQDFVLVDKQGDYNPGTGTGSVSIPSPATKPGTLTWNYDTVPVSNDPVIGDRIQAVWIGQDLSKIVGQPFGFTSYSHWGAGGTGTLANINTYSLSNMLPVNWDEAVWGTRTTTGAINNPFQ